ncbi:hypothetical protein MES4922_40171 [Mesorhizobium ventifaucium]|uniref:Uncharacterized protein n=1 Tax=Mesorhizobium ventifaucium TaxID=666020 RepID=A0ABM9E927_9HYPH|nr:hypothetical protein MES4922_40171 [Mesorhizobium ventifaucium]
MPAAANVSCFPIIASKQPSAAVLDCCRGGLHGYLNDAEQFLFHRLCTNRLPRRINADAWGARERPLKAWFLLEVARLGLDNQAVAIFHTERACRQRRHNVPRVLRSRRRRRKAAPG